MVDLHDILLGDVIPESGINVSLGRNTYDGAAPTVPVHDIHSRSQIFHDSGTHANSGITTYNAEQNRLELIPGNSGAQPITTNVTIDVYGLGSKNIGGNTTLNELSTSFITRYNSHEDIFSLLPSGIIQINMSGIYSFRHNVSIQDAQANARSSYATLWYRQRIDETGFLGIPGTSAYITIRGATVFDKSSAGVEFVAQDVQAGDMFWPVVLGQSTPSPVLGPSTTQVGSRITVEKVG